MIDWRSVAVKVLADAAKVDSDLRFGVSPLGQIGSHLWTAGARLPAGVYWVRGQCPLTADELAGELAEWAGGVPVGVADLAARLGVEAQTARNWRTRGVLPAPDWTVSGSPVWRWATIEAWARETGRLT